MMDSAAIKNRSASNSSTRHSPASTARFYLALLLTSLRSACARRLAFLMYASMMIANNVLFFVTWWVLYRRVPSIGGWEYRDMQLLYGICALSFGVYVVFLGGVRRLSEEIYNGALDPFLLKPRNILGHLACSSCRASGWGDIVTGAGFLYFGVSSPSELLVCLVCIGTSSIIFFATAVLFHSAAFWLSGLREISEMACEVVLLFSMYPGSLFSGWIRIVLFTLIPAGFLSSIPVAAVRSLDPLLAVSLVCAALAYLMIACWVFSRGLLRYESGSRIELGATR